MLTPVSCALCLVDIALTERAVHPIIRESPFFDHTSKNGLLWGQAERDMRLWQMVMNREAFETQLRSMNGVEYMIVGEPQPVEPGSTEDTGIWVIRKQDRRKRPNGNDEITVLGTYYLVGENMYQAPSVYDIVGNHLVCAPWANLRKSADGDNTALNFHFSEQVHQQGFSTAAFHTGNRPYILPACTAKANSWRLTTGSQSDQQRR